MLAAIYPQYAGIMRNANDDPPVNV